MWLLKVLTISCVFVTSILGICKESDNFVFECQFWEDVVKLSTKPSVKNLSVKNKTIAVVCDGETFREFTNLTVLNVNPGGFTEIQKDCFNGLKHLECVQVMENDLETMSLDSLNRSLVERLWLDQNKLTELSFEGLVLPLLRSLDLSGNLLKTFKITTANAPDIRILDLAFNNLTTVQVESISLSFLKMQGNLLTEFSADMIRGDHIRMLYLSENKLQEIRGTSFEGIPKVEFVHLEKNPVKLFDFSNFNVTDLRCTDELLWIKKKNREVALSVDLTWDDAEQLILSNNSLNRMDVFNFTSTQKIAELSLDHNLIREIKRDDLKQLENLIVLDLTGNRISSIEDGSFERLKKLHSLSLAKNCIHGLSDHMFQGLNSLFSVDLSKNIMTYFVVSGWTPENKSISIREYHPFLSISTVKLDETLLRCTCKDILNVWMDQLELPIFSLDGVTCLDTSTPCLNIPIRDERIDTSFGYCTAVEEVVTEAPSLEIIEYDDF